MVTHLLRALRLCSCSLFGDHQRMAVSLADGAGGPSKHTGSCGWLRCAPGVALLWAFPRVWVLCPHPLLCCSLEALLAGSALGTAPGSWACPRQVGGGAGRGASHPRQAEPGRHAVSACLHCATSEVPLWPLWPHWGGGLCLCLALLGKGTWRYTHQPEKLFCSRAPLLELKKKKEIQVN